MKTKVQPRKAQKASVKRKATKKPQPITIEKLYKIIDEIKKK